MTWEERRNGHQYYYRKRRHDGRVVTEYVGTGAAAVLTAQKDAAERQTRQTLSIQKREQLSAEHVADQDITELEAAITVAVKGILESKGYYLHKRQWRKRGKAMENSAKNIVAKNGSGHEIANGSSTEREEVALLANSLMNRRAEDLTSTQLQRLREGMKLIPDIEERVGNMAFQTRMSLISSISQSVVVRECVTEKVHQLQERLGWTDASTAERLLIERVTINWIRLYGLELRRSQAGDDEHTLTEAMYWERLQAIRENRYVRSLEALTRVRRLMKSTLLQVNIAGEGGQQINQVNTKVR